MEVDKVHQVGGHLVAEGDVVQTNLGGRQTLEAEVVESVDGALADRTQPTARLVARAILLVDVSAVREQYFDYLFVKVLKRRDDMQRCLQAMIDGVDREASLQQQLTHRRMWKDGAVVLLHDRRLHRVRLRQHQVQQRVAIRAARIHRPQTLHQHVRLVLLLLGLAVVIQDVDQIGQDLNEKL